MNKINASLIIYPDGKNILIPKYNETNIETVILLDENNNIIQNITYETDIVFTDIMNIKKDLTTFSTIHIFQIFLFYTFQYQISFHHYLIQLIPKLEIYSKLSIPCKLGIPKHTYTKLTIDLLNLYGIDNSSILLLENNHVYKFKELLYYPHISAWSVDDLVINTYSKIRNKLNIPVNNKPFKKIYLKRDGKSNQEYNNCECGLNRKILNELELEKELINNGFSIITLGNKSILEKSELLNNSDIIITQNGANICNLLFTNQPNKLIILTNENYKFASDYYIKLLNKIYKQSFNYKVFSYTDVKIKNELNANNNSFIVNINNIINYINERQ